MPGSGFEGSPVRAMSFEQLEAELAKVDRALAEARAAAGRAHADSQADDTALRQMAARVKELSNKPKGWGGGAKRADAAELQNLRDQMKTKSESVNRSLEWMKTKSEEARELAKRQQALSTRRSEMLNQRG